MSPRLEPRVAPHPIGWLQLSHPEPLRTLTADCDGVDSLLRDGLLLEVWPGVLRAGDLAPGPADRAAAVVPLIPPGAVLARQSAVWVHTGLHRPTRLDVVLPRPWHRRGVQVRTHVERLPPVDIVTLGDAAVTGAGRTAVDVARHSPSPRALHWIQALLAHGLQLMEVAEALDRSTGLAGAAQARALLEPLLDRHGPGGCHPARKPGSAACQ